MNQYQWTFLDNLAQRHTLGIAHSANSGHLLIYCDYRVVMIRFGILTPETFHFLVEQELCRLSISGSPEQGFSYDFQIDKEAETELNKVRNARQKKEAFQTMLKLGAMSLVVMLFLAGVAYFGYYTKLQALPEHLKYAGIEAVGQLKANGKIGFISISKNVEARPIGDDRRRLEAMQKLLGNELQIPVRYELEKPRRYILDWPKIIAAKDSVGGKPLLMERLQERLELALPELSGGADCALRLAAKRGGWVWQLELLDAYLLDNEDAKAQWEQRFLDKSYQQQRGEFCSF